MEIFAREYLGKLSLSLELAKLGNEVFIGNTHTIKSLAEGAKEDSVYFEIKGQSGIASSHIAKLKKNKILIVGQDEEAGISFLNFEDFAKFRPELSGLENFDSFFSWGEVDLNFLASKETTVTLEKTGSPRTAFWGSHGEAFYRKEAEELMATHGEYILLVTNLAWINSLKSSRQENKLFKESNYGPEFRNAFLKRTKWEALAHKKTLEIVKKILIETEYKIILRPHPSENIDLWRREIPNEPRIMVSKKGPVTPLILGACHILHSGSTVGIESMLLEKSTLTYQDLLGFEDFPMTANRYSQSAQSLDTFVEMLVKGFTHSPREGFSDFIKKRMSFCSTNEPAKIQARIISNLRPPMTIKEEYMELNFKPNKIRRASRIKSRILYGKNQQESLNTHKRPEITLDTVLNDVKALSTIFEIENQFDIKRIAESTFKIAQQK